MADRLCRSRKNKWVAGVCGGIAEYFHINAKFIRLLCAALILTYGSGLLVYIVLAIFIPKEP